MKTVYYLVTTENGSLRFDTLSEALFYTAKFISGMSYTIDKVTSSRIQERDKNFKIKI